MTAVSHVCYITALWICCSALLVSVDAAKGKTEVCGSMVCRNYGRCVNSQCSCLSGYTGPQCDLEVSCEDLRLFLKNAIVPVPHSTLYGALVRYQCAEGYQFPWVYDQNVVPERLVRCGEDAKWGPDLQDCLPMCPTVATWRGYRISTLQRVSGTRLMYQCDGVHPWFTDNAGDTKYEFASGGTGVKISTCSENGTWVPPIEDCVDA